MNNPFEALQTPEAIVSAADEQVLVLGKDMPGYSPQLQATVDKLVQQGKLVQYGIRLNGKTSYVTPKLAKELAQV